VTRNHAAPATAGADPAAGSALRQWSALAFVALVAISFAANSALAGLAYAGGSNPLSVLLTRSTVAVVALFLLLRIRGVPIALPPRRRALALGMGLLMSLYFYGLFGAMEYIPVALAVLTFYTYPIITAVVGWVVGRDRVTLASVLALAGAVVGITLALDVAHAPVHPAGIALGMMAAVGFAVLLEVSERTRASGDSRPVTLHMLATTVLVYGVTCILTGKFSFPVTALGWVGFAGSPLFFSFSIVSLFIAVSMIGPFKTALTMYFEPVASALFGFLILAQALRPTQILGIAMVTISIIVVHRAPPARVARANAD